MNTSQVKLNFKCPKAWNSMSPEGSGRFCCDCKKVVRDFSESSIAEINTQIASNTDKMCGSFRAYQLDKPFGDWRDKFVSYYQTATLRLKSGSLLKPITVFALFLVMLITGCARRLTGDIEKPTQPPPQSQPK